ncbi:unnamed protein product, partial [Meganyctiphanes norvegica]
ATLAELQLPGNDTLNITNKGEFILPPDGGEVAFEDLDHAHTLFIAFHVILPIFAVACILVNALSLVMVMRPRLNAIYINLYLKLLIILDLLTAVSTIPASFAMGNTLCNSYAMAFYQAHFGMYLVNLFRFSCLYVWIWVSFDRFMAIWFLERFQSIRNNKGLQDRRLLITGIWILAWMLPVLSLGEVKRVGTKNCWVGDADHTVVLSTEHTLLFDLALQYIPYGVLILLSIGLAAGVVKKRLLNNMGCQSKRSEFYKTLAILILNLLYVLCYCLVWMMPVSSFMDIVILWTTQQSAFLVWSMINTLIIFFFHKDYHDELMSILPSISIPKKSHSRQEIEMEHTSITEV